MDKLPIELINIIKDFIIYKPKTNIELRNSVDIWCYCNDIALKKYGHISNWDISLITNTSRLFMNKHKFNDNIQYWNVSNVTNMKSMFESALKFNQSLNNWNLKKLKNKDRIFYNTPFFNKLNAKWCIK